MATIRITGYDRSKTIGDFGNISILLVLRYQMMQNVNMKLYPELPWKM